MTCPYCSREIPEDSVICPYCGAVLDAPAETDAPAPAKLSRTEFFKTACSEKVRKELKAVVLVLYICAGLTFIVQLLGGMLPIDGIILAGLAFWIQKTKSMASAIVTLVYAVLSMLLSILVVGNLSGWLIVLAAVFAVIYVNKGNKEWKAYEAQFE